MTRFPLSIHAQLTLFVGAFVAIVLGLAAVATFSLKAIDAKTEQIDQKWLAGTRLLGELSDRISEFRIAEAYRALARDAASRAEAERLAGEHRRVIEALQNEYVALFHGDGRGLDVETFRTALTAYLAEHDAWLKSDPEGLSGDPARHGGTLHKLYRAADEAVDGVIQMNAAASHAESGAAYRLTNRSITIMAAVSGVAVVLAAWIMIRVRRRITRPLGAITEALSKLAAGDRDIQMPGMHRDDEIGAMAKTLNIFRANALALEEAHEATRVAQEHAQALARHDSLTGLPNRRVFSAELQEAIGHAQSGSAAYSVLIVDLDRFKPVNDLQGHPVGDAVLCAIARRLEDTVRKSDTIARLGGDEFAIITKVEPRTHSDQVMRLAARVLGAIREPILVDDGSVEVDASIGIASCPADGVDAGALLRAADIAMYRAKQEGRGTFRFFEQRMDEELRAQAALEAALKKAIADEEIRPFYQPLVDLRDNRIYGFEMLARWRHPERGSIPPDVFIPLAEQLGVIADLTRSVVRRACRDALQWSDDIDLSINISPLQLKDPLLSARLLDVLAEEGFPPSRLEIEITESALVGDVETAKASLAVLQAHGVKVSLDDFGTGYSSLYHLRAFKFDKVKIDRSFVLAMQNDSESEKIVDAILSLSRTLGLPTVAEGIETAAALRHLAERGCEYGQGYYFGRAMSVEEAVEILDKHDSRRVA